MTGVGSMASAYGSFFAAYFLRGRIKSGMVRKCWEGKKKDLKSSNLGMRYEMD